MSKKKKRRGGRHSVSRGPNHNAPPSIFRPLQRCTNGHVSESPIAIGSGAVGVVLTGNVAQCRCGASTFVEDGRYSFIDGVARIVQTTSDRQVLLDRLGVVAEHVEKGSISSAEAHSQIEEVLDDDGKAWWRKWRSLNPQEWSLRDWLLLKAFAEKVQMHGPEVLRDLRALVDSLIEAGF